MPERCRCCLPSCPVRLFPQPPAQDWASGCSVHAAALLSARWRCVMPVAGLSGAQEGLAEFQDGLWRPRRQHSDGDESSPWRV